MKLLAYISLLIAFSSLSTSIAVAQDDAGASEPENVEFAPQDLWAEISDDILLFYAYRENRGFDDVAYFERLGERLSTTQTILEFRRELHASTFAFTDPHFIVGPFEDEDFNIFPTSSDMVIKWKAGEYLVQDVRAASAAYTAGVRPGWKLISSQGIPLETAVLDIYKARVDDPSNAQKEYGATLLANGRRSGTRKLQFITTNGSLADLELASPRDLANAVKELPPLELDFPIEGVARLRVNNALGNMEVMDDLDVMFAELPTLNGFILDLRNTPSGGNTTIAQAIMGHFVNAPKSYQIHDYPSMEREFGVPRRSIEVVLPRARYIDAPLVVLAGGWTGSMGEGMVIGLEAAANAHVISSDMADLLGGLSNFTYADGAVKVDMGTYSLSHMNGTPREAYVAPMALDAADTDVDGHDPGLAAAIDYFEKLLAK